MLVLNPVLEESYPAHLNYPDKANVRYVRIIGDFNEWSAPGEKLSPSLNGGGWTLDLNLSPGVYRYVFLTNGSTVPTGKEFDHQVRILVLPPADFKLYPEKKGDGTITPSGILHQETPKFVRRLNLRTYALRIRTRKNDVANEAVAVRSEGHEEKIYPMKLIGTDPLFDYFEVKVVVDPTLPFTYRFLLDDGAGIQEYDRDGLGQGILSDNEFRVTPNEYKTLPFTFSAPPTSAPISTAS